MIHHLLMIWYDICGAAIRSALLFKWSTLEGAVLSENSNTGWKFSWYLWTQKCWTGWFYLSGQISIFFKNLKAFNCISYLSCYSVLSKKNYKWSYSVKIRGNCNWCEPADTVRRQVANQEIQRKMHIFLFWNWLIEYWSLATQGCLPTASLQEVYTCK